MNITAFSESQAAFLQRAASARPKYWEYACLAQIRDAHFSGDTTEILISLQKAHDDLNRGLIELPPQRNLSQYYTTDPGSILVYRIGDGGNYIPDFIEFTGPDPLAWLTAAYENAAELLAITKNLIEVCMAAKSVPADQEPFILDPPVLTNDPRLKVIQKGMHIFSSMTAEDVLHVFDTRKGLLTIKEQTKWKYSIVLEAIRKGLGIAPRALQHVKVQGAHSQAESWLTDEKQNRLGANVSAARSKGFKEFPEMEKLANEIIHQLNQMISS